MNQVSKHLPGSAPAEYPQDQPAIALFACVWSGSVTIRLQHGSAINTQKWGLARKVETK